MSAPVPLSYAEKGNCTERKKDRSQNNVTPTPGDACAEERQGGEQSKVARLGVHSRSRLKTANEMSPPARQDSRPSFWERPSHALPGREFPAARGDASRPRLLGGVNGW